MDDRRHGMPGSRTFRVLALTIAGVLAGVALSTVLVAPSAHACSPPPPCWHVASIPEHGAEVPVNIPYIQWRAQDQIGLGEPTLTADQISFARTDGDSPVPVPFELTPTGEGGLFHITPEGGFQPDATYRLRVDNTCAERRLDAPSVHTVEFTTVAAVAPPTALAGLTAAALEQGSLRVTAGGGLCSSDITAAYVDVTASLPEAASPWLGGLHFETHVNGTRWSPSASFGRVRPLGASWTGRGTDRLYTRCATSYPETSTGLDPGTHTVQMRARLPGSDAWLETPTIEVTLACEPTESDGESAE